MYLFGKNRAKGKPELNGSVYGPTPYKEPDLSAPPGRAKGNTVRAPEREWLQIRNSQ